MADSTSSVGLQVAGQVDEQTISNEHAPRTNKPFRFLDLPLEIRNMIYDMLLVSKEAGQAEVEIPFGVDFTASPPSPLFDLDVSMPLRYAGLNRNCKSIFFVNKQIYREAALSFYGNNTLRGSGAILIAPFFQNLGRYNCHAIQKLCYQTTEWPFLISIEPISEFWNSSSMSLTNNRNPVVLDNLTALIEPLRWHTAPYVLLPNLRQVTLRLDWHCAFRDWRGSEGLLIEAATKVQRELPRFTRMLYREELTFIENEVDGEPDPPHLAIEEIAMTTIISYGMLMRQITLTVEGVKWPKDMVLLSSAQIDKLRHSALLGCHPSTAGL